MTEHVLSTRHQGTWHCEEEGSDGSLSWSYSCGMGAVPSKRKRAQSGRDWRMPQTKGNGCVLLDQLAPVLPPPGRGGPEASLAYAVRLKSLVVGSPEMLVSPSGV